VAQVIALLQRVTHAAVHVDDLEVARIGRGLAVLIGVLPQDREADAENLLTRVLLYRIFDDEAGRMNLSLRDIEGGLLLVPQFTLAADTRKGLRPGFSRAAPPALGKRLFEHLAAFAARSHRTVQCGVFGAHMLLSLTNDGPATFWLSCGVKCDEAQG
jgi:D-tyrosyl-tRNA(Tyr) deacylase